MTADPVLRRVLRSLDYAVFTAGHGALQLANDPPDWLDILFPGQDPKEPLTVPEESFFLHHFMEDAGEVWSQDDPDTLSSGPWIEERDDDRLVFEAIAVRDGEGDSLIIRQVRQEHDETRAVLQKAREFLLDNEVLERVVAARTATIREREEEIALRLASAAEWRDSDTGNHIRRIGDMAVAVARRLGCDRSLVDDLWLAAAMHDIGKIGIPDDILQKPGPLTPEERSTMQTHAVIGRNVLEGSDASLIRLAAEVAHHHHEHVDGRGYPNGLKGDEIPLSARIVAVADVYDALTTDRVYRSAWPLSDVLAYLEAGRATQFDSVVLSAFMAVRPDLA